MEGARSAVSDSLRGRHGTLWALARNVGCGLLVVVEYNDDDVGKDDDGGGGG